MPTMAEMLAAEAARADAEAGAGGGQSATPSMADVLARASAETDAELAQRGQNTEQVQAKPGEDVAYAARVPLAVQAGHYADLPNQIGKAVALETGRGVVGAVDLAGNVIQRDIAAAKGTLGTPDAPSGGILPADFRAAMNRDLTDQERRTQVALGQVDPVTRTAGKVVKFLGGLAPAAVPVVGVPVLAAGMGGNTYEDARESGADEGTATTAGGIATGVGAAAPLAGKLVAPLAKAAGARLAPVVGKTVAGAVEHGAEGAATGEALQVGGAAATAAYDPEAALEQLKSPEGAAGLAALAALVGGERGRMQTRAERIAADQGNARKAIDPFADTQHGARTEAISPEMAHRIAENVAVHEQPAVSREAQAQRLAEEEATALPDESAAPVRAAETPARDGDLDAAQRAATAAGLKGGFYRDQEGKIVYDPARAPAEVPAAPEAAPERVTIGKAAPERIPPAPEPTPAERARADEESAAGVETAPPAEVARPEPVSRPATPAQRPAEVRSEEPAPSAPEATSEVPVAPTAGRARISAADLRAQLDALPIARRAPGFSDTHMALVEARARSAGITPDEYVGRRIAGVVAGGREPSLNQRDTLLQRLEVPSAHLRYEYLRKQWKKAHGDRSPTPGDKDWERLRRQADMVDEAQGRSFRDDTLHQDKPLNDARGEKVALKRGAVQFLGDGRAIIHAFEHADRSTILHELGHVFRRDLTGEDLAIAEHWTGVKDGRWTRGAEEKFARGFERWVRDGVAPTPALRGVFRRFYDWLHEIYKSVIGSPIDVRVSPQAKALFERLLQPDAMKGRMPEPKMESARAEPSRAPSPAPPRADRVEGGREPAAPVRGEGAAVPSRAAEPDRARPAAAADVAADRPKSDAYAPVTPEAKPSDDARLGGENTRPDLATPGVDAEARRATVEARNDLPGVEGRKREDIRTAAQKRVDKDPEGTLKGLLTKSERGTAFNAEDMGAAQALLDVLGKDPKRAREHRLLVKAYQLAGNEGAVAMGMRVDRIQTPEGRLAEARDLVALPRAGESRRIEKLRAELREARKELDTLHQEDSAAKLRNRIKKMELELGRLETLSEKRSASDKAHLKRMGFDLDEASPDWARDPDRFQQFIAALEATRGGLPAVAREIYVSVKHLSGTVFGKKVVADMISLPYRALVRHIEAVVAEGKRAVGLGRADEASAGELAAIWRATVPALKRAGVNALESLRSQQHPKELMSPEDSYHYPAMRGVKGEILRHAGLLSTVRAIDAFTRSFVAHVEVAGRAYRSGVDGAGKRLEGEDLARHVENETSDYASQSWGEAREAAMRSTFTEKPMEIVRRVNRMKYQQAKTPTGKALKFIANVEFPFTTIPSNIAKQGVTDWTPGLSDAITIAKALRRDPVTGEWAYDGNKFNEDVAKAAVRWGAFMGFGALASAGVITGEEDKENPLSVHIAGHWLSFRHLGPIARAIGAAADWFAPAHRPEDSTPAAKATRTMKGSWAQFGEMPLVRFATDLVHAAKWNDGWTRYAADQTANLAPEPSIVHQGLTAAQDEVRHRANMRKNVPWLERYLAYTKDRLTSNSGKPVRVAGHPLVKDRFDSDVGTYLWRILSPMALGNREPEHGTEPR